MTKRNEHDHLIAAAAKAALAPIGCFRSRRSRLWLSDNRYWAVMVEFQPSSFSKGCYLNVGASWLWYEKKRGGLNFNVGYRVDDAGFIPFESAAQFRPLIDAMAARAALEVQRIQMKFSSIDAISRYLNSDLNTTILDLFHAAVAAGLNGETQSARSSFERLLALPMSFEWQSELRAKAAELTVAINDLNKFRYAVADIIKSRRLAAGLPSIEDVFRNIE